MIIRRIALIGIVISAGAVAGDCDNDPAAYTSYDTVSTGTRRFEWDSDAGTAWIKVLVEEKNLGSAGVEVAEVWFPPGYEGQPHQHALEILYVLEGELDHVVNGESHRLKPGMTGIVRARDRVAHRALSADGVRVLVVWPLGGEVAGLAASGMRETKP